MTPILLALAPVLALILLGLGLRRFAFKDDHQWAMADKLNYFLLFPSLLAYTLGTAELGALPVWSLTASLLAGLFCVMALTFLIRPFLRIDWPAFTSMFQGAVRWNGFVALAVTSSLFGRDGVAVLALGIVALIPIINVACVLVLSGNTEGGPSIIKLARSIATNPLILGCVIGLALNPVPMLWETPFATVLDILARASLPLGLLSVGAALTFKALASRPVVIGLTSVLKLIAMPLLIALWCGIFGVDGTARSVAIICGAVCGTPNSYVLAKQMGGDAPLMAAIVTVTVIASMVTMPLLLWSLA